MRRLKDFINGFKEGIKNFGENITIIINSFLLSIVYFIGVGITSLFARLVKKRFLDTKILKETKTYWSNLNLKKKSLKEYYRQF